MALSRMDAVMHPPNYLINNICNVKKTPVLAVNMNN
jgi:hypothetical protein